jgi:uncharacterized protein HemY
MNLDEIDVELKIQASEFWKHYDRWTEVSRLLERIEEKMLGEEPESRFLLEQLRNNVMDELAKEYKWCESLSKDLRNLDPKILNKFK